MNRRPSMEGANCADLPPFVIDKYFDCDNNTERFAARTAKAICSRCVVLEDCRGEALTIDSPPKRGVIAGVSAAEITRARAWRRYELGIIDTIPGVERPEWLSLPEAAQEVEQHRLHDDVDEPAVHNFTVTEPPRPILRHASQRQPARPAVLPPAKATAPTSQPATSQPAVPVAIKGANCGEMPSELVERYFRANVATESANAATAITVCQHCPVLDQCRDHALAGASTHLSGVIAGMGARELERGRAWRRFEYGFAEQAPRHARPSWLPWTDASTTRQRSDGRDELPVETAGGATSRKEHGT